MIARLGRWLGRWLSRPTAGRSAAAPVAPSLLLATLQPGDVLLVEGVSRIATAIKYLTQSTWSHAALYVGQQPARDGRLPALHCFVEADVVEGVRSVPIAEFAGLHTRICRPVGLSAEHRAQVIAFALARIGHRYDLRNVFDLARYLFATPPVPSRVRRRMLALGSGDPTRAICSTLVAESFQRVRFPILPELSTEQAAIPGCADCVEEIARIRHHSLFAPRDFDVSPYFAIVKPTIEQGFDYRRMRWSQATAAARED